MRCLVGLTATKYCRRGYDVISRAEGYHRSVGKEQLGINLATLFLQNVLKVIATPVTDQELNYTHGDLVTQKHKYLEVKTQPIDPHKYRQNFVEVFEVTQKSLHATGFNRVAELLGISPEELQSVLVTYRNGATEILGNLPHVSVSLESLGRSSLIMYVNPYEDPGYIYVYEKPLFLAQVRDALLRNGLRRGIGNSNADTFAVFIANATQRWQYSLAGGWRFIGEGTESEARRQLTARLL